jgi:hypothetical protein
MTIGPDSEQLTTEALLLSNAYQSNMHLDSIRTNMGEKKAAMTEAGNDYAILQEKRIDIIADSTRLAIAFINEANGIVNAEKSASYTLSTGDITELFAGDWIEIDTENRTITIKPIVENQRVDDIQRILNELKKLPAFAKKLELKGLDSNTANIILGMNLTNNMEELKLEKTVEHITNSYTLGIKTLSIDTASWLRSDAWCVQSALETLHFNAIGADAPLESFVEDVNNSTITTLNITCGYNWFNNAKSHLNQLGQLQAIKVIVSKESMPSEYVDSDDRASIGIILDGIHEENIEVVVN